MCSGVSILLLGGVMGLFCKKYLHSVSEIFETFVGDRGFFWYRFCCSEVVNWRTLTWVKKPYRSWALLLLVDRRVFRKGDRQSQLKWQVLIKLPSEVNLVMFRFVEHSRQWDHRCFWKNMELTSSLDVDFSYGSV